MNTLISGFRRNLVIVLVILFLLTQALIFYPALVNDPGQPAGWMILSNLLLISIPLTLLYGSLYMVIMAWREHTLSGQVEPRLAKFIHWAARVAVIVIGGFLSLFSFDVFEMQAPPLELLAGFLIHNLPTIALLVLLAFAWKRPAVGFVAFLVAAMLFAVFFVRDFYALSNLLLFVLPLLLIAALFYVDWKWLGAPPALTAQ
jgi:hypothetical protein